MDLSLIMLCEGFPLWLFWCFFPYFLLFLHVVHLTIYVFIFSVCLLYLDMQVTTKYLFVSK